MQTVPFSKPPENICVTAVFVLGKTSPLLAHLLLLLVRVCVHRNVSPVSKPTCHRAGHPGQQQTHSHTDFVVGHALLKLLILLQCYEALPVFNGAYVQLGV